MLFLLSGDSVLRGVWWTVNHLYDRGPILSGYFQKCSELGESDRRKDFSHLLEFSGV